MSLEKKIDREVTSLTINERKEHKGFIFSVFMTMVDGNASGFYIAGIGNYVGKSQKGAMIAVGSNYADGCSTGLMIAASNYADEANKTVQIGLYNKIEESKGPFFQLGLVNYCDGKLRPIINFGRGKK